MANDSNQSSTSTLMSVAAGPGPRYPMNALAELRGSTLRGENKAYSSLDASRAARGSRRRKEIETEARGCALAPNVCERAANAHCFVSRTFTRWHWRLSGGTFKD